MNTYLLKLYILFNKFMRSETLHCVWKQVRVSRADAHKKVMRHHANSNSKLIINWKMKIGKNWILILLSSQTIAYLSCKFEKLRKIIELPSKMVDKKNVKINIPFFCEGFGPPTPPPPPNGGPAPRRRRL